MDQQASQVESIDDTNSHSDLIPSSILSPIHHVHKFLVCHDDWDNSFQTIHPPKTAANNMPFNPFAIRPWKHCLPTNAPSEYSERENQESNMELKPGSKILGDSPIQIVQYGFLRW